MESLFKGNFLGLPGSDNLTKIIRPGGRRATQDGHPGLAQQSLGLAFADTLPLILCHKDRIWSTRSAMKVPMRSLPLRVSSRGMSNTQMSTPISLVKTRHWVWISS